MTDSCVFLEGVSGILKNVLVLRRLDTTWKTISKWPCRGRTLWHFQRARFSEQSFSVHFCRAAHVAEIKPFWDSIKGLFLHVQIVQAFQNKTAGLETPLSYNFHNWKTSSQATCRLPANEGMNKYNGIALIFRAIQTYIYSSRKKNTSKSLLVLDFNLLCSGIRMGIILIHSFSELFLTDLTHFFWNHSEYQGILITVNIHFVPGMALNISYTFTHCLPVRLILPGTIMGSSWTLAADCNFDSYSFLL